MAGAIQQRLILVLAVAAGLLIALSVPPFGFWPLGIAGAGLLGWLLRDQPVKRRALIGLLGGLGLYAVTISWFAEFNAIGAVLAMIVEAAFMAGAAALTQPRRGRRATWVAALVLQEWVRTYIPFGGVPLGGIALGQAAGPIAPAARVGGRLEVIAAVALGGVALEAILTLALRGRSERRNLLIAAATFPIGAVVIAVVAGRVAPSGHQVGTMRVAAVQGGGRRGLRAIHNSPQEVYQAQIDATALISRPVDLILWPEDVIALGGPVAQSPVAAQVGQLATAYHAALLAGVTEDVGATEFRNAEVVWDDTGAITGRYDKVHRVPFGEYIPLRSLVQHFVNLDVIPRDAIAGRGSGEVSTQAGPVAITISFEVFFSQRARSGVRAGGQVLLVPTNTASYRTTQVTTAEIASERLLAWETGRSVVMAAPTGWSAVLSPRGAVLQRSRLGAAQVVEATVPRRTGLTPYDRFGDWPLVGVAVLALGLALLDRAVQSGKP